MSVKMSPAEVLRQRAQNNRSNAKDWRKSADTARGDCEHYQNMAIDLEVQANELEDAADRLTPVVWKTVVTGGGGDASAAPVMAKPPDSACNAARVFDERYKILNGHKVIRLTRGSCGVVVRAWCTDGWEYGYSVDSTGQYMAGNRTYDVRHANGDLLNEKDGI